MILNDDNFLLYASNNYWSIHYTTNEFLGDVRRIYLVKSLIKKYLKYDKIKERILINYLVLIFNVFEKEAAQNLLFFAVDSSGYSVLKTFLLYLNQLPETIEVRNTTIYLKEIPVDMKIAKLLNGL